MGEMAGVLRHLHVDLVPRHQRRSEGLHLLPVLMPSAAKKLIVRIGLLISAVVLTGVLASQYDVRKVDNDYIAAVLEKDRLIRNTPSPKIILVGGSNLAFGIDSHMICLLYTS